MNRKKVAIAAGAVAALASAPMAASAAPLNEPAVPPAASYADLLAPIPNAVQRLQLADAQEAAASPELIQAQFHHHHHHHHHGRRWYLAHGYAWIGGVWVLHPPHHHHHHHHHHTA